MADATGALVGFGQALRNAGLTVATGQVMTYCRAVTRLDPGTPDDVYWAGRATLISRHADVAVYDRTFDRYFGGARDGMKLTVSGALPRRSVTAADLETLRVAAPAEQEQAEAPTGTKASAAELLRHKRFTDCTAEELAALHALMSRLRLQPPQRRSRRTAPARKGRHDLRRTVRQSLRSHGEPLHPRWRAPRTRPRRVVLLLDVSGSMAGYSRALLQFSHSAATTARTEVFCFGTRLTRVTPQLRNRRPDKALAEAAEAVVDWEGGTRIGESLGTFVRAWGRRSLARGAVVVICSDGLERGDPALVAAEMGRLARLAHRIVWVNPLKGDARYQPLAAGMSAALPYVDALVAGHNLASLEALADLLDELT